MKKIMPLLLTIALISVLAACGSGSTEKTFDELSFTEVSHNASGSDADTLNFTGTNESSDANVNIYFYDTGGLPLAEGTYDEFVLESNAVDNASEIYFTFSYISGTDYYFAVARSGSVTVSGSNININDVVFDVLCYDYVTEVLKSDTGSVTETGTLTIQ